MAPPMGALILSSMSHHARWRQDGFRIVKGEAQAGLRFDMQTRDAHAAASGGLGRRVRDGGTNRRQAKTETGSRTAILKPANPWEADAAR